MIVPPVSHVRHVGQQHLHHHLLALTGARAGRLHLHAFSRCAAAAGGQRAFARDLDHAGAAVAVGAQAVGVAQVRDLHAVALRGFQNSFASVGGDGLAVQLKGHTAGGLHCAHGWAPLGNCSASGLLRGLGKSPGQGPSPTSCAKYL
ncbi:hypothetical protein D3C71_1586780 [compost metagenome]